MSTIHTARNIVGNDKTTPLFSLKGLVNLAPTTITALNIQGVTLEKQVAYTQYAANISSFIHATVTNKTVVVTPAPLGYLNHVSSLPLSPPTVSFTLQKPLDTDRSDKFVQVLGPGASKTQSGKTTIYHAPSLPIAMIDSIIKISTPFFNAGRDAVNPKGINAYKFINTIVCVFLNVHSYPAFRNEDKDSMIMFEQLVSGDTGGSYHSKEMKTKNREGVEITTNADISMYSHSVNVFNKRERSDDDMDDESPMIKIANTSAGVLKFRGVETVTKASPVKRTVANIGSSTDVPKSPGHIFPYFTGLIQPDAVFMNSMILRRFYQLLGSTHQQCQQTYLDIRHGINSLASTPRGMELCHILLGIELALDTQSRCFLIIDKNQYLGFSLLGARYAIFCNSKWCAPVNEEIFINDLSRMDPHESAIQDMTKKLEDLAAKEQYTGIADKSIFHEPRKLVEALDGLKIVDIDDEDIRELDRCIRNLNYMGAGYLTQNPQMISEMLETLASNKSIELSRPTFLPSIRAPMKSKVFALLSRFGPEAPSFWNDRGTEIACKPTEQSVLTTGGKRKIGTADVYGNMPMRILVTPKPLLIAVRDMERVVDKGKVKMDVGERAGKHRNISMEHEETKKRVWKGLVDICADSGKKTKVDTGNGESDNSIDVDEIMAQLLG